MARIGLGRETWLRTFLLTLLLAWPLLVFQRPAYISDDSVAYLKGGKVATEFVFQRLGPPGHLDHPDAAAKPATAARHNAGQGSDKALGASSGVRSASYSALAYLLRQPDHSMIGLSLVQSFLSAFIIVIFASCTGLLDKRRLLAFAMILAAGTPLAVVSNLIMPDIFAGILIVAIFSLIFYWRNLSPAARIAVLAVIAFANTLHASLPPLSLAILLCGTMIWVWKRHEKSLSLSAIGLATAATLAGMGMTALSGKVAFDDASIAPKRFPLALARSVSDGPARWYLERECREPRYAVCEVFGTNIPDTIPGFLFVNGLRQRATPEQMDRIRAEESGIVVKAAMRYPWAELKTLTINYVRQLLLFQNQATFDLSVTQGPEGDPVLVKTDRGHSGLFRALDWISYVIVAISLIRLGQIASRLTRRERDIVIVLAGAILSNAFIVVVFSGVAPRYEARLIWVVPLVALLLEHAVQQRAGIKDNKGIDRQAGREFPERESVRALDAQDGMAI